MNNPEPKQRKNLLLLKFQSKEGLTYWAGNLLLIEITTNVPGALISISAGLGKQHLMCLQTKWLTLKLSWASAGSRPDVAFNWCPKPSLRREARIRERKMLIWIKSVRCLGGMRVSFETLMRHQRWPAVLWLFQAPSQHYALPHNNLLSVTVQCCWIGSAIFSAPSWCLVFLLAVCFIQHTSALFPSVSYCCLLFCCTVLN